MDGLSTSWIDEMKDGLDRKLMIYLAVDTMIGFGVFWVAGSLWAVTFWVMSSLAHYIFVRESGD